MISPQPHTRPLPRYADRYFESQVPSESHVDLTGLGPRTQRMVLWSKRTLRGLPRLFQPLFRGLALALCFGWFAWEEVSLWWTGLDWPRELRVLTFAVWTMIAMIVGLMLFDLFLSWTSAGLVR